MVRRLRYRSPSSSQEKYSTDNDDDYSNRSSSHSAYESNHDDEYEPPINNKNGAVEDSESVNYSSSEQPSSSQLPNHQPTALNTQHIIQSPPYINIAPLPIFHGEPHECPIMHLSRFGKVCRANNVSSHGMMMRIFPVTLETEAALWYDLNIDPYPLLTWEEIKSSFLHAYNKIELVEELRSDLMIINQGEEESVRSYFLRLQAILTKWPGHGLSDSLLRGIFIDGLLEDYQNWIMPQKPGSLKDALSLAFGFEQVKSIRGGKVRRNLKCGFCEGGHEELGCEVRERMRELWRRSKEEQKAVGLVDRDDQAVKGKKMNEAVAVDGDKKLEEGEMMDNLQKKKNKKSCQCSKHQCGKNKLEKNYSLLSRTSNIAD